VNTFDIDIHSPLFEMAAFGSVGVLLVLAILTLRAVVQRDRAITFGRPRADETTLRAAYENRWRRHEGLGG